MIETFFERAVRIEMGNLQAAALNVLLDDPIRGAVTLARLQGQYAGLKMALKLQRTATRSDVEDGV